MRAQRLICFRNKIFIRQGDKVDREDGLDTLPLTKGEYGRWAKIGQYESGFSNQREAPAIIKHDGYFYMVASGISGWKANAGIYLRTKSPFDEWETVENPFKGEGQKNYAETSYSYNLGYWSFMPDTGKSFLSQSTCLFEYNGTVYYMGDRWKDADYWDDAHLGVKKSTYVWAPVVFKDNGDKADNMEIYWTDTIDFSNTSDPDVSIESVTKTDGKIDFSVKLENAPSDSMLITALYDSNNNLVKILVGSESGSFEVEADKNYVFKAMLWNDEQKPLTDARSQEV